jgi:hypothetical protein
MAICTVGTKMWHNVCHMEVEILGVRPPRTPAEKSITRSQVVRFAWWDKKDKCRYIGSGFDHQFDPIPVKE